MLITYQVKMGLYIMASDYDLMQLMSTINRVSAQPTTSSSPMQDIAKMARKDGRDYVVSAVQKRFENPALQAAILASIEHETGGSFSPYQKQYGGGAGRGLIQMEGDMLKGYQKYLKTAKTEDTADAQLDFLKNILESGANYDIGAGHRNKFREVVKTNNPKAILEAFTNRVERPGKPMMDARYKALNNYIPQEKSFGNRADGTPKGSGFLGVLKRPDGGVSTEISVGVNLDGKEIEIPTLVPTLSKEEVDYLLGGGKPTKTIIDKAVSHAISRMKNGLSPFK